MDDQRAPRNIVPGIGLPLPRAWSHCSDAYGAHQPEDNQNKEQQAKSSAETRAAKAIVAIITTAAEQQQKYNDDK
jgi:hypothetical protein